MRKILLIVSALALMLTLGTAGGAVADRLITGHDIKDGTVRSADLRDGTVKQRDLSVRVRKLLAEAGTPGKDGAPGATGATGAAGDPASDVLGGLAAKLSGQAVVANIGGSFASRATLVGTIRLPEPGTYLVSADAFFDRIDDASPSSPVLQLAVRGPAGELTAFTGNYPATGDREQSASTSRLVTGVGNSLTLSVYVFGYNNDGSSAGGGNYAADVEVSAVKVG